MKMENSKWKLIAHSSQIADTGDNDGYWELTNDNIHLITKDDNLGDVEGKELLKLLNYLDCKWENWKQNDLEFELHLEKENCKKWKEIAKQCAKVLDRHPLDIDDALEAINMYKEVLNNLP